MDFLLFLFTIFLFPAIIVFSFERNALHFFKTCTALFFPPCAVPLVFNRILSILRIGSCRNSQAIFIGFSDPYSALISPQTHLIISFDLVNPPKCGECLLFLLQANKFDMIIVCLRLLTITLTLFQIPLNIKGFCLEEERKSQWEKSMTSGLLHSYHHNVGSGLK